MVYTRPREGYKSQSEESFNGDGGQSRADDFVGSARLSSFERSVRRSTAPWVFVRASTTPGLVDLESDPEDGQIANNRVYDTSTRVSTIRSPTVSHPAAETLERPIRTGDSDSIHNHEVGLEAFDHGPPTGRADSADCSSGSVATALEYLTQSTLHHYAAVFS